MVEVILEGLDVEKRLTHAVTRPYGNTVVGLMPEQFFVEESTGVHRDIIILINR